MITYHFTAMNAAGEKVRGYLMSESEEQATKKLDGRSYTDIELTKSKRAKITKDITSRDLAVMCRQMASVMASDMSVLDGLLLVAEQSKCPSLQLAISNVYDAMFDEETLSEAMGKEKIFPSYLVNMLKIGEASGEVDVVFSKLADYYDKDARIRSKVRSAVTYPLILALLMIWVIGLLVVKILPMFEGMLLTMGGELPAATKALLSVSGFVASFGWIVLLAVLALVIFCMWFKTTEKGRALFDRIKLGAPISGPLQRRLLTARFAHGMAMLLESGVTVEESLLKITPLMDNVHIKEKMTAVMDSIKEGKALAPTLAGIGVFPSMLLRMLSVGEKTGRLSTMFSKSATFYDDDVDQAIQRMTTIIEPVIIIVLSIIVGIILLSVMLPLINIMSMVG